MEFGNDDGTFLADLSVAEFEVLGDGAAPGDSLASAHGMSEVGASVLPVACCSCCIPCCCCT